jgi:glycerol uptake operon antiterminator
MIEIMPATVGKVITRLAGELDIPIIAGGLIETHNEVAAALLSGASAVSTGARSLWNGDVK